MVTFGRVQKPNEVFINGFRFKLAAPVQFSLASQYPQRQITGTGEITQDSDPTKSVHEWNDWRQGLGADRGVLGETDRRSFFSTASTQRVNHLLMAPLAFQTAVANTPGDPLIGELGGAIVAAFGTSVESYSPDAWTSRRTLTGTPTDVLNLTITTTEFLVFAHTTGYESSSAVATWAQSTKDAVKVAYWDNRLWGIDATGQLWYTFTVGSAEVNNAQLVLARNDVITGLFTARDPTDIVILYCSTEQALYAHDFDNCRWVKQQVEISPEGLSAANLERKAVTFQDQIFLASGSSTINYNTAEGVRVREMGFDEDDGLPIASFEQTIFSMAASVKDLLVGGKPLSSNDTALLLAWDKLGWRVLWESDTANQEIVSIHVSRIVAYRAWLGFNNRVWYIRLNQNNKNPKQISGWQYDATAAIHKTPWFDAGQHEVDLTALECIVDTRDCTANETVRVRYALNYNDASYTTLGTISSNGRTVFTFPDNGTSANAGQDFQAIRIELLLSRGGTDTLSPDVTTVLLIYRKKLRTKWLNTFTLNLTERANGTPKEQRARIVTAIEATRLVEVTFRDDDGNTRNFYCDLVAPQGEEQTGRVETGQIIVTAVEQLAGA